MNANAVIVFLVANGVLSSPVPYYLPFGSNRPYALAFSPDGAHLVTANAGSNDVTVFAVSLGGVLSGGKSYRQPSASQRIAFSSDGTLLAIADTGPSGLITLFNFNHGVLSVAGRTNVSIPNGIVFSPDSKYLAATINQSNGVGAVLLFSVSSAGLNQVASYALPSDSQGCGSLAFTPDGAENPSSVVFSPDGKYLAVSVVSSGRSKVVIFDVTNGVLSNGRSLPLTNGFHDALVFSSDGLYLIFTTSLSPTGEMRGVTVYNFSNGMLIGGVFYGLPPGSYAPESIAFSPTSVCIATGNVDSSDITLFAQTQGTFTGMSYPPTPGVSNSAAISFSPDGKYLATANGDAYNSVTLFSLSGCAPITTALSLPPASVVTPQMLEELKSEQRII